MSGGGVKVRAAGGGPPGGAGFPGSVLGWPWRFFLAAAGHRGGTEGPGMRASGGLRAPLRTGSAGGRRAWEPKGRRTPGRSARPWRPLVLAAGTDPPGWTAERPRPSGRAAGRAPARACVPASTTAPPSPGSHPRVLPVTLRVPSARSRRGRAQRDPGAPPASRACPGLPWARAARPQNSL